jgi:alpha-N-acetylglucosaminidase
MGEGYLIHRFIEILLMTNPRTFSLIVNRNPSSRTGLFQAIRIWSRVVFLMILLAGKGLQAVETPLSSVVPAAYGLIERVIPHEAGHVVVETLSATNDQDVFEVEGRGDKIVLRGNSGVSIASALNWYLQNECHCDISWNCGDQLRVPKPLPAVPEAVRIASPHKYRYAYNFCTHGYTMAWWDWPQWQRELDYLALNGINLALIIEGQESVWVQTLKNLGYTDEEVRAWLVMPSHQPWMYMDNMESYGGPVPQELMARRLELGRKILSRMRELGMEPVLPGYYGMVPPDFQKRFPGTKVHVQGDWGKLKRPDILDPADPVFAKVAREFYAAQNQLFGGANFYAADPFHEGGSTENIDMPAAGRAIFDAMNGATWVLQSWQANPRREMIDALDKNKLLVLDLFCEDHENWRLRDSFYGTPWLWCTIHNFGGNVDMGGRLAWMGQGPVAAMADPQKARMSGIGALMEGSQVNPVVWEYFFGNAWHTTAPNLSRWLDDYVRRRYGAEVPAAQQAWKILAGTIYNAPVAHGEFPVNSVVCARPSLDPNQRAREWASTEPYYDTGKLVTAWKLLLDSAPQTKSSDGYRFDLCDVSRQVLANLARDYDRQIIAAYKSGDAQALRVLTGKMLGLIRDLDVLTGTRQEFLFGNWLADARSWGQTGTEKDLCERNARELLTVWTSNDSITDYSNRQWSGLLGDFYYHRWQLWLEALSNSLTSHVPLDEAATRNHIRDWELSWTRQTGGHFATKPHGDTVAVSLELFARYSPDASLPEAARQAK